MNGTNSHIEFDGDDFGMMPSDMPRGVAVTTHAARRAMSAAGDASAADAVDGAARTLIETRSEFHAAIRQALDEAAAKGCRELWLCDVNYANWPLGEIRVVEALTQWAHAHRKLVLHAFEFEEIARRHSRWVEWRRRWAHVVECRALVDIEASQVPTILLAPGLLTVRLFDPTHYRGAVSSQKVDLVAAKENLDAVSQRSFEAFPATTLGL